MKIQAVPRSVRTEKPSEQLVELNVQCLLIVIALQDRTAQWKLILLELNLLLYLMAGNGQLKSEQKEKLPESLTGTFLSK